MELKRRDEWNLKHFLICLSVATGQLAFAYPSSIIGTTLAQPTFLKYMSLIDDEGKLTRSADALIGAMSGVYQAGGFFGIFAITYVMGRWGRKAGMLSASGLGLVGGALLTASQNVAMFIVFRFVAGASAWAFLAITPVYTSELAPPALRGLFVGMCGLFLAIGYAIAGYMGLAFHHFSTSATQWRAPYGLSLVFNLLAIVAMFYAPESPRWLLMQGRDTDAKTVVQKLHNLSHEDEQHFAMAEFYQMKRQSEHDRTVNPSWWQMFRRPSYRKRVILTTGYAALAQCTGVLVINNYGSLLYQSLGYDNRQQLVWQCGWLTVSIAGNLLGALFLDRIGRKPLMVFGIAGCLACLIWEAVMVAKYASPVSAVPNEAGIRAAIAALYVFVFCYSIGVDVGGFVFFGEVYPNHLRAKGLALTTASSCLSSLVFLEIAPTAFRNIGWKYYLVFICFCVLGVIWTFLALPETNGRPLEEIATLFGDRDEVQVFYDDIEVAKENGKLVIQTLEGKTDAPTEVKEDSLHLEIRGIEH